jgi:hypothetical protein
MMEPCRGSRILSAAFDKSPVIVVCERLTQLLFGVHYDRPAPRNRLLQRFSRYEEEAASFVSRKHTHLIASVEQHHTLWTDTLLFFRTEMHASFKNIRKAGIRCFDVIKQIGILWHGDIKICGVHDDIAYRSLDIPESSADYLH